MQDDYREEYVIVLQEEVPIGYRGKYHECQEKDDREILHWTFESIGHFRQLVFHPHPCDGRRNQEGRHYNQHIDKAQIDRVKILGTTHI